MNWFSHWDEDLDCLEASVPLTSKNSDDFKIPTDKEINALFATSDMSNYEGYPSISTNEYIEIEHNLDLKIDNIEEAICKAKAEAVDADVKIYHVCPHCGESYYMENYSTCTAMYFPPIYKDGVNINPDRNQTTTYCTCMNCGKNFSFNR